MAESTSLKAGSECVAGCFRRRILLMNRFEFCFFLASQLMSGSMLRRADSVLKLCEGRASNRQSRRQWLLLLLLFGQFVLATTNHKRYSTDNHNKRDEHRLYQL